MTEAEWNVGTEPAMMLEFLRDKASARKLRLFAVACCRRAWHLLLDERSKQAVELSEQFAEGQVTSEALSETLGLAWRAYHEHCRHFIESPHLADDPSFNANMIAAEAVGWVAQEADPRIPDSERQTRIECVLPVARETAYYCSQAVSRQSGISGASEDTSQAALLRDVFGNPFRPVTASSAWLTTTVVSLAHAIYEDRAFDRLPILADALEDAGCDNPDLLAHCRGPGPHVRGCFAVDLVLGKK